MPLWGYISNRCRANGSIPITLSIPPITTTTKSQGHMHNLTGQKFGRLTVLDRAGSQNGSITWRCMCDCGKIIEAVSSNLLTGNTQSCGCLRLERLREKTVKHGMTQSHEYIIWTNMIGRCQNPNLPHFKHYGGRGIKVCERWRGSFQNFYDDMGPRPSKKHTLDRKENDGDYTPENCRWATRKEQANNKVSSVRVEFNGITLTVAQWAEKIGMPYFSLRERFRRGWTPERALTEPRRFIKQQPRSSSESRG